MSASELLQWIKHSFPNETLQDTDIQLGGTSGKTDGYLGDINFVKVTTKTGKLSLVIKNGKRGDAIRESIPIRDFFIQEIKFYKDIIPAFLKLQRDKGITELFQPIPRFYGSEILQDTEVIILEDLRTAGYVMHKREEPLSFEHLKTLLQHYGKLHALSFAMNDQRRDEFNSITQGVRDTNVSQLTSGFSQFLVVMMRSAAKIVKEKYNLDYTKQVNEMLEGDLEKQLVDLINVKMPYPVFSHGDAWINNYLFLYKSDKVPSTKIVLLDWQMAATKPSPVFDLAHFLYGCSSAKDLADLERLLTIYYESFSGFLKKLGTNPEIFTYKSLLEHWKRFSFYGFAYGHFLLKQSFWSAEDASEIQSTMDEGSVNDNVNQYDDIVIRDEDYYERLVAMYKNYFSYQV